MIFYLVYINLQNFMKMLFQKLQEFKKKIQKVKTLIF